MQKWQTGTKSILLCNQCTREYSGIIVSLNWQWLEDVHTKNCRCDECGCSDRVAEKYGSLGRTAARFTGLPSRLYEALMALLFKPSHRSDVLRRRALTR